MVRATSGWARWVESLGRIEGYSWLLLLFVAMPLKYVFGFPLAVRIVGSAHGALFVAFVLVLGIAVLKLRWPLKNAAALFATALLPFGFLFAPRWLPAAAEAP
ncbi:MAG: DUF3817 domain-containing protein [Myxococcota bacterium]